MIKMKRLADNSFEFVNSNTGRVIAIYNCDTHYESRDENGIHKFDTNKNDRDKTRFFWYLKNFAIGNEKAIEYILKDLNYV